MMKTDGGHLLIGAGVALVVIGVMAFNWRDAPSSRSLQDAGASATEERPTPDSEPTTLALAGGLADSDDGLGPLPDLPVDAEQFVRSDANPFRCLRHAGRPCTAESDDPMIARSPAEARWMMQQGFPETPLREKVAGWTSVAIRQEAERSGSATLKLLALERQAEEAVTPEQAEAVADEIGRWKGERERRSGKPGGGTYAIVSRAKALAHAYKIAEAREQGSGRTWAVAAVDASFDALVWGDTLALEQIQPFFWGGMDEFMSFSDARSSLQIQYNHMRMGAYLRSRGVSLPTVSDIQIRPVPELREVQTADGRVVRRWYGEP